MFSTINVGGEKVTASPRDKAQHPQIPIHHSCFLGLCGFQSLVRWANLDLWFSLADLKGRSDNYGGPLLQDLSEEEVRDGEGDGVHICPHWNNTGAGSHSSLLRRQSRQPFHNLNDSGTPHCGYILSVYRSAIRVRVVPVQVL